MVFQACLPFGSRNRYEVLSCNQASLLQKPLDPSSSAILTHRGSMQGSAHPECLRSVQNRRPMDLLTDFSLAGSRPVNWNVLVAMGSDDETKEKVERQLSVSDYARSKGGEVIALAMR